MRRKAELSVDSDRLIELFEPFGPVSVRRMFGGAGLYRDGVMFALAIGDEIFLKCDRETKPRFSEAGCRPFVYDKDGKPVEMSYWSLPEAALDDPDVLKHWADLAMAAALRARKPKSRF